MASARAPNVSDALDATEILPPEAQAEDELAFALPPGSAIGPYRVERVIGGGGCGVVYAARDTRSGEAVAVKVLRPELAAHAVMVSRFLREIEAVGRVDHPNIAAVLGVGEIEPGRPYFAMELVHGVNLRRLLEEHGRFSPAEALALMEPLCGAVQAAHDAGVIHRDIKASNVLVADGTRTVKLVDFGIAKLQQAESEGQGLTDPGGRLGTPHNMAPEQVRCERVDTPADVYALGVLLYQLLTGEYPFRAEDALRIALLHLHTPAPRPSALAPVPLAVDAVVLRALEKQPARRYASARELASALHEAVRASTEARASAEREAIVVRARLETESELDLEEDAVLDALDALIDRLGSTLEARGFTFPLRTASSLVAIRLLAADEPRDGATARALRDELARALAPHRAEPRIQVRLRVRTGRVLCRDDADAQIVGGSLLDEITDDEDACDE